MDTHNLLGRALLLLCISSVAADTPKPSISLSPPWNRVFQGENVTLTCHYGKGSLLAGTTNWTHNNRPLKESTSSLSITSARELDSGEYRCQGEDSEPSDPVHLGVFSAVPGRPSKQTQAATAHGDAVPLRLTKTERATMERPLLTTLLLPLPSVDLGISNLEGRSLLFPRESATDYVLLTPTWKKPLHRFTLCMKAFSDLPRDYSLFSYATRSHTNALLLHVNRPGEFSLSIGDSEIVFRTPKPSQGPFHVCVTWESATGIATLWVDGRPQGRKGVSKGYVLGADAKIILGQDQDSFGGKFDAKQSLVGEVWEVHFWDKDICIKDIWFTRQHGNLINWHLLNFQSFGDVVSKANLWF